MIKSCRVKKFSEWDKADGSTGYLETDGDYICPKALNSIKEELPFDKWVMVEFEVFVDDNGEEYCTGEARIIED